MFWRLALVFLFLMACHSPLVPMDVTNKMLVLENPLAHPDPFSRNVWDLQRIQDRVLIGSGDAWRNTGTNVQKIQVVSYSSNGYFNQEFTVDDEQIHRFIETENQVLIPGFDPLEDWSLGNFYTLEPRCLAPVPCWSKTRTIPFGVHTYDLIEFAGKLYSSIGGYDATIEPGLLESSDGGRTWKSVTSAALLGLTFTRFFSVDNQLFAVQEVVNNASKTGFAKLENGVFVSADIAGQSMVPTLPTDWRGRLGRITTWQNKLFYTAAAKGTNVGLPEAAFVATSLGIAQRIPLALNEMPTDILRLESQVALLTTTADSSGYTNRVYLSSDGQQFQLAFSFISSRFARSFEKLGSTWIFGLGCVETESCQGAGRLLSLTL